MCVSVCTAIDRDECPAIALNKIDWEIVNQNDIFTQY